MTQSSSFGHSSAAVLVRRYAIQSKNEADKADKTDKTDKASAKEVEAVKKSGDSKAPKSKEKPEANAKETDKEATGGKDAKLVKEKSKSPAPPKSKSTSKKKPSSPADAEKKPETRPSAGTSKNKKSKSLTTAPSSKGDDDAIDIMKEALAVLRDFQENPLNYSTQKKGEAQDEGAKQSLRSQFAPIHGGEPKLDPRQRKILTGTLDVLKSALTIQAERRAHQSQGSTAKKVAGPKAGAKKEDTPRTQKATAKEVKTEQQQEKQQEKPKKKTQRKAQPQQKADKAEVKNEASSLAKATEETLSTKSSVANTVSQGLAAMVASSPGKAGRRTRARTSPSETSEQTQKKGKRSSDTPARPIQSLTAEPAAALEPVHADTPPVPLIQYGLDRVLFNEGVYALQDPRTRVWNFDPYLANIMPVTQFDFDALKEYITSSKDKLLLNITRQHERKYTGSTSSMTSTLAHFHYLLSGWRSINKSRLSKGFESEHNDFSMIQKAPAGTFLNYKDGAYAIDADKEWDNDTILSMLGKSMEKLLTVPKDEFEKYRRSNSHQLTGEERNQDESYHYTTYGDFMMRSQLDAYDPRLPGTGIYDLKTRAVVSIRMDARNVSKGSGYEIRQRLGEWQSFEREYFDMMRSAFLKYSLQVRMGRMDGIFVAYHNTERIFGFQYIPLEEMDQSMHGTSNKTLGDKEFTASLKLWNELLNQATAKFPGQSLRTFVETKSNKGVQFMYFFAEPVTEEDIKEIQEKKKEDVDHFRQHVLGMPPQDDTADAPAEPEATAEPEDEVEDEIAIEDQETDKDKDVEPVEEEDSEEAWEDMMAVVEQTMDNDAQGITAIRDAIEEALEQSGLLRAKSSEEAQHFIESLLRSIVDVGAERAETEKTDAALADLVEAEKGMFQKPKTDVDSEPTQPNAAAESPPATEPPAPKKSALGFLSGWFGSSSSSSSDVETPTKEATPSDKPQISECADHEQEQPPEISSEDADKDADSRPSAELVDLILKLTSSVGSKTFVAKDTQERPEDLAKLDLFRSILSDMMAKSEGFADAQDEDASSPKPDESVDIPPAGKMSAAESKPIFGMTLTIRNKVNDKHVDRPENLKEHDSWTIEYTMEEMTDQKQARTLYSALQRRRKAAFYKVPGYDPFNSFGGALRKYTEKGREFREQEAQYEKDRPVWIVGQPEPLDAKDVFEGAGAALEHVLPMYERPPLPSLPPDALQEGKAEAQQPDSSSFREWREKNTEKQGDS